MMASQEGFCSMELVDPILSSFLAEACYLAWVTNETAQRGMTAIVRGRWMQLQLSHFGQIHIVSTAVSYPTSHKCAQTTEYVIL
jgi:hypothetical protein